MFWRKRRDEDDVDRLNRVWTVLILVVAGISGIAYIAIFPDAAISCLSTEKKEPGITTPISYVNLYCLDESSLRGTSGYGYYQDSIFSYHTFIPLFLFYQVLGFLAPHIAALFFKGIFVSESEFLFICAETSKSETEEFKSRISSPPAPSVKYTIIYLCKKGLYLLNSFIQLVFIAVLFSPDKSFDAIRGRYYTGSATTPFPRFASCRIDIKGESTQNFQCALHINGLYLKFFMFLFYWLLIVVLANVASLILWFLKLFVPRLTSEKIKMYTMLKADDKNEASDEKSQTFVKNYLGKDYLLNLLLAHSTERETTAADLTLKLWKSYECPSSTLNTVEATEKESEASPVEAKEPEIVTST